MLSVAAGSLMEVCKPELFKTASSQTPFRREIEMTGSTITTNVTNSVTLGSGAYPGPLTIAAGGSVDPTASGANAIYGATAGVYLLNQGSVLGGAGLYVSTGIGVTGGAGVDLAASGTITNSGVIGGGAGGNTGGSAGGAGGIGILLSAGGTVTNSGTIAGGAGGNGVLSGGVGGIGVDLAAGGSVGNAAGTARISGGYGGSGHT